MLDRFLYYYQKFMTKLRKQGPKRALLRLMEFLIRRRFFLQFLLESAEYEIISRFRSEHGNVIGCWDNKDAANSKNANRFLVYVSYDAESGIQSHVVEQLRFFRDADYRIIFVSTSPHFSEAARGEILPFVETMIHRKNKGYDFLSYKLGVRQIVSDVGTMRSFILMNDSCTGPLFDFRPALDEMVRDETVVYGITKSDEITEYIQSYFIHFGGALVRKGIFSGYVDRIRMLNSKWAIVRFLEIGGSRWLRKNEVVLKALVDTKNPAVSDVLRKFQITEPTRDPAASEFIRMGLLPFKKRKHGMSP